jgi:hypothetical protein
MEQIGLLESLEAYIQEIFVPYLGHNFSYFGRGFRGISLSLQPNAWMVLKRIRDHRFSNLYIITVDDIPFISTLENPWSQHRLTDLPYDRSTSTYFEVVVAGSKVLPLYSQRANEAWKDYIPEYNSEAMPSEVTFSYMDYQVSSVVACFARKVETLPCCSYHPCTHSSFATLARKKYSPHLEDYVIATVHVCTHAPISNALKWPLELFWKPKVVILLPMC